MSVSSSSGQTPLMKQYHRIKSQYPGTLLLFRVGDFYEAFEEDAQKLHDITNIKLTSRAHGAAAAVALAGFPHHALDVYLPKLVRAGLRVAVCDQIESPQKGKQIVDRQVTELVTPGITYHDQVLERKYNNYLASIHFGIHNIGVAFLDISTGEFLTTQGQSKDMVKLIEGFSPAEIIFSKKHMQAFQDTFQDQYHHYYLEDWVYDFSYGYRRLNEHFGTLTLKGFGIEPLKEGIIAAGAILRYLETTEHRHLQHITHIARIEKEYYMWLDKFTIRNLELLQSQQEGGVALIDILDHTVTPMGARRFRKWLLLPLKERSMIQHRLDMVALLVKKKDMAATILFHLKQIGDIERLISKVASKRINPRELQTLKKALQHILPIQKILEKSTQSMLVTLSRQLDNCHYLIQKITQTLQEDPPIQSNQGGLIKKGISDALDAFRETTLEGSSSLHRIQVEEKQKTGISSLKIGYNKIFGYYLEVTNPHKQKVPNHWIRKQTLVNAERYVTEPLKKYEEQILHAQEKIVALERQLYETLVQEAVQFIPQVQQNARILSYIDCYHAFATTAHMYHYVQPHIQESDVIDIKKGRHPVIERCLPVHEPYVPNDTYLDDRQQILLITGPNMAGKSALLRQVALIVLMAHVGSFVPAQKATIGLIDKIFTRVGASDNIAKRESTFMVEMNEMASILHNLSQRSLVIVDELGRGTGTTDGLALAQSIIEYLHDHPKYSAKTLFATHYHELNSLASQLPKIKNYKVVVKEVENKVLFLHKLTPGGSQNSFGIQVAKMAGIPTLIIEHALEIIAQLQAKNQDKKLQASLAKKSQTAFQQPTLFEQSSILSPILKVIEKIDVNTLTPVEALLKLEELKRLLPKR